LASRAARTVNPATVVAFGVASLFGVGDWFARARAGERRALEYLCKPATLAALVVAAVVLAPGVDAQTRRSWFVAALAFSLAGDVLLMLPRDLFVAGLAAFLVGHLCYLAGFWAHGPSMPALLVAVVVVVAVVAPLARRILTAIARSGQPDGLRVAVTAYMAVISAMLATALATGNPVAGCGAVLFVASDSMIAWDRFVRPFAWAPVAIMVTYHLGQAGLVASLVR
jgi:uncharacterized membrane protein YhhN